MRIAQPEERESGFMRGLSEPSSTDRQASGGDRSIGVPPGKHTVFAFGPYTFLPHRQVLLHGQTSLKVGARALDVLHALLLKAGDLVTKEDLISFAWPDVFVDEGNLKVHIRSLRRILEETRSQPNYIATVSGRGYRFISPVSVETLDESSLSYDADATAVRLPPRATVIGRQDEIQDAGHALEGERLVTLVGPAGVGKTTVAVAVAHTEYRAFPDGVHFVDLAATNDQSLVTHLVATTLGLRGGPSDVTTSVVEYLRGRRTLIVLDNCEHVLAGVTMLATTLINVAVRATVLATSREPLGCKGEVVLRIRPLGHPGTEAVHGVGSAMTFPSIQLFALRASEQAAYTLSEEDVPAVARLCALMDGIPLAIEILASKMDPTNRAQLLDCEEGVFAETWQNEDNPLWAAFEWSYRLLSPDEALTYRILSVFPGRFEPVDVATLSKAAGLDPFQSTVALGRLVAHSLVTAEMDTGVIRYSLLECSRRYAAQRLLEDERLHRSMHLSHARLALSSLSRSEDDWHWTESSAWRLRYEPLLGDVRQALDWCFEQGDEPALGVSLAAAAIRVWNTQSSVFEQMRQVERALKHAANLPEQAREVVRLAVSRAWSLTLARQLGPETDDAWRVAVDLSERCADPTVRASTLSSSATYLVYTGRSALALDRLRDGITGAAPGASRACFIEYDRRIAFAELHVGHLGRARERADALAKEFESGSAPSLIVRYKEEPLVGIKSVLAFTTWLAGQVDQATAMVEDLVERTGNARQLMGQSHVLALYALPMAAWGNDAGPLRRVAAHLRLNLEAVSLAIWEPVCRFYDAFADRDDSSSLNGMRAAVDELIRDRLLVRTPMYLGLLADAERTHGQIDRAGQTIERALSLGRQGGERWCLPELLRIKAGVLAEGREHAHVHRLLGRAGSIARRSGASFFERRILDDIAALSRLEVGIEGPMSLREPVRGVMAKTRSGQDATGATRTPSAGPQLSTPK